MCKVLVISHSQDIARNIELVDLPAKKKNACNCTVFSSNPFNHLIGHPLRL